MEVVGVEPAEGLAQIHELGQGEILVEDHAGGAGLQQGAHGGQVAGPPVDGPIQGQHQEILLAFDPPEVVAPGDNPPAVHLLLVGAAAHVLKRLDAIEDAAARRRHVKTGAEVASRVRKPDRNPAENVDDLAEAQEVDLHVVVDRHFESGAHRFDQQLGAADPQRGRDLVIGRAGYRNPQVPGHRQHPGRSRHGVQPQQHDGVGQAPALLVHGAADRHRIAGIEAAGAVGADQQEVHRLPGRGVADQHRLPEAIGAYRHPLELQGPAVKGRDEPGRNHRAGDHGQAHDDHEALRPRAPQHHPGSARHGRPS